jgi:hypothetical protein
MHERIDWRFSTVPQTNVKSRVIAQPRLPNILLLPWAPVHRDHSRGKVLGGSSAVWLSCHKDAALLTGLQINLLITGRSVFLRLVCQALHVTVSELRAKNMTVKGFQVPRTFRYPHSPFFQLLKNLVTLAGIG